MVFFLSLYLCQRELILFRIYAPVCVAFFPHQRRSNNPKVAVFGKQKDCFTSRHRFSFMDTYMNASITSTIDTANRESVFSKKILSILNSCPAHKCLKDDYELTPFTHGNKDFLQYMHQYSQMRKIQLQHNHRVFVYTKKGTTGLAGQIQGACSAFYLSILHNRAFQIHAPLLTQDFFDFPFEDMLFSNNIVRSSNNNEDHVTHSSYSSNTTSSEKPQCLEYHKSPSIEGAATMDLDALVADPSVLQSINSTIVAEGMHEVSERVIMQNPSFFSSIGVHNESAYSLCLRNLFVPNSIIRHMLNVFRETVQGSFVVGVHVRTGGCGDGFNDTRCFTLIQNSIHSYCYYIHRFVARHDNYVIFLSSDYQSYPFIQEKVWKQSTHS